MSDLVQIIIQFSSLAGCAALVAVIINILKQVGVVKDGTAGKWSAALNIVVLAILIAFKVFVPSIATDVLDGYAGQVAQILLVVLGYLVQLFTADDFHNLLAKLKIPVIGKSYSKAN
jgi:hypothetical protein